MNWLKKIIVKIGLRKTVATTVIAMVICIGGVVFYQQCANNPEQNSKKDLLVLEKESEIYEYGDTISLNPVDYVVEGTSQDVLNNIDVNFSKVVGSSTEKVDNITDKQEVGIYYIVFTYCEEKDKVKIEVKDTQAPVIELKQTEVSLEYGKNFNANSYVTHSKDPVDGAVEYTVEGEVNTKKAGTYTVIYKAVDKNGNEATATLKVTVKDKKSDSISNKNNNSDASRNEVKDNNICEKDDVDCNGPGGTNPNVPGTGDDESIDDPKASMGGQPKDETPKKELKPWTPNEVPNEKKGQAGVAFKTWEEAEEWALAQIADPNSKWYGYSNYFLQQAQKYGQEQHPNDPWVIRFVK